VRLAIALVLIAGCGFQHGMLATASDDDAGTSGDDDAAMGSDSGMIDTPGTTCTDHVLPPAVNVDPAQWSASFLTAPTWTCTGAGNAITLDSATGMALGAGCTVDGTTIATNVAQQNGPDVLVVRLRGLTITNSGRLRLTGNKPIILLVAGTVVVDSGGLIDAGAKGAEPGPGGSLASVCTDRAAGRGDPSSSSGYGGGGGGFGTAGGQGGYNNINGGAAQATPTLVPLRGGCSGGASSSSNTGVGAGGGAFEISATGTITIGATAAAGLSASGGGAPAATAGSSVGGHGGGSGGGILLVAPALATLGTAGAIRTNGGAGSSGCGGSCNGGSTMYAGSDGHATDNTAATDTSGTAGNTTNDRGRQGGVSAIVGATPASAVGDWPTAQTQGGRGGGGGGGGAIVITTGVTTAVCD
jgi:hypothetical protein